MKKYFFTGLAILLPFTLTILVAVFLIHIFTAPFQNLTASILSYFPFFNHSFWIFSQVEVTAFISQILILGVIFGTVLLIGFLGQQFIGRRLFNITDRLIRHIPVINKLYATVQEAIKSLFLSTQTSFAHVVLVPFPHKNSLCLALLPEKHAQNENNDNITAFMPGAAMHSMGLMMNFRRQDVIFLDMKVEDAIKFYISFGVVVTNLRGN